MDESYKRQTNWERMANISELYYIRGMTIEALGHELGISRSTVSRVLAQAREYHVIDFYIHRKERSSTKLAAQLQQKYHIHALVVDTGVNSDKSVRELAVGKAAASLLEKNLLPNMVLGVTWGRTVESLSLQLDPLPLIGVQILQLHGFGNSLLYGENYVTQILTRFGNAFDAKVHLLPLPAIFDSENTRNLMYKERSIQNILQLRKKLDLIVTSVGSRGGAAPSRLFSEGMLTEEDIQEFDKEKVIGNLASTFFRSDGSTEGIEINKRSTGLARADILRVPMRLFIVGDRSKVPALRVALNSGFVTHLVVDQETASCVLSS